MGSWPSASNPPSTPTPVPRGPRTRQEPTTPRAHLEHPDCAAPCPVDAAASLGCRVA